ncbi:GPR endopeptidase [Tumebacillus algifaecis]|uniref:Germination protease n=1 Tax=Tumebacillus algifaecis TaxID=1214604 RepID=A0A223D3P0_9BACL|nr:GPR endopeptidase [Tumebacillus algifaecis]ASS76115.1 GPR endopeptidase [Tumebacillus algifaecis]
MAKEFRFGKREQKDEQTEIDWNSYSVSTDLALEAHQIFSAQHGGNIPGVKTSSQELEGITVTRLTIENEVGSNIMGKMVGNYLTFEVPGLRYKDPDLQKRVAELFAEELKMFVQLPEEATVLVIGLGNRKVTPDSLGPLVCDNLFVTRHLFDQLPELVEDGGYRSVAAVAPGVLGITGIETSEIVHGIVKKVKPDLVIAVDALAARSLERVNTTIQVADVGISPGAGVGNKRKGLNKKSLGVPVVAVGVPTVVDAVTITSDAMDLLVERLERDVPGNGMTKLLTGFDEAEKKQLIFELLHPLGQNLMVTPKEVDTFVEDIANVLANGLNVALHDAITMEDASLFTH